MLFNLHFVGTIITLINLNNFKYPTKIRLCSHPNQNDLLRDLFFRSQLTEINGNR